jgi:hypothetical protein
MPDKKYKISSGERITIEINRQISAVNQPVLQSRKKAALGRGIIRSRRNNDYLSRRRRGGFINFYDLGQKKISGVWQNVDFSIIPPWILANIPFVRALDSDDYALRDSAILDLPMGDGRRIEQIHAEKFVIVASGLVEGVYFEEHLNSENPNWTASGLKLTTAQLAATDFSISFSFSGFFQNFVLTGEAKNKITRLPDASADAVDFAPGANMIFYLPPAMAKTAGDYFAEPTEEYSTYLQQLNYFYQFRERVGFLNDIETNHKTLDGARLMLTTQLVFAGPFSHAAGSAADYAGAADFSEVEMPEGFLLAIIKQNNQIFYVWK